MYQNGSYKEAQKAYDQMRRIKPDGVPAAGFLQAMIHWQLGDQEEARRCYAEAAAWLKKTLPGDEGLSLERTQAATLLELEDAASRPSEAARPHH
jgi:hypothetical protein